MVRSRFDRPCELRGATTPNLTILRKPDGLTDVSNKRVEFFHRLWNRTRDEVKPHASAPLTCTRDPQRGRANSIFYFEERAISPPNPAWGLSRRYFAQSCR